MAGWFKSKFSGLAVVAGLLLAIPKIKVYVLNQMRTVSISLCKS